MTSQSLARLGGYRYGRSSAIYRQIPASTSLVHDLIVTQLRVGRSSSTFLVRSHLLALHSPFVSLVRGPDDIYSRPTPSKRTAFCTIPRPTSQNGRQSINWRSTKFFVSSHDYQMAGILFQKVKGYFQANLFIWIIRPLFKWAHFHSNWTAPAAHLSPSPKTNGKRFHFLKQISVTDLWKTFSEKFKFTACS